MNEKTPAPALVPRTVNTFRQGAAPGSRYAEGFAPAGDGGSIWFRVDAFQERETSDLPVVVLIGGLGADESIWDDTLASLRGFTIIRFHNRGIGNSSVIPSTTWSTRDSARDVIAVLDAVGVITAAVYGHSLGGRIAQWVAADFPHRVDRLVLGATTVGDEHGVPRPLAATAAFESGDPMAVLELVYTPAYIATHPEASSQTTNKAKSPEQASLQLALSTAHDGLDAIPRIQVPVLVVHGSDDGVTNPRNATILHELLPHSDLLVLDNARHGYFSERRDANAMIAAFLSASQG